MKGCQRRRETQGQTHDEREGTRRREGDGDEMVVEEKKGTRDSAGPSSRLLFATRDDRDLDSEARA